jgi:hypothetical protein
VRRARAGLAGEELEDVAAVDAPVGREHRIWRLRSTLEEICRRRAAGLPSAEQEGELEDALTLLAAQENGVPERWVRPFVRRVLRSRLNPPAPG